MAPSWSTIEAELPELFANLMGIPCEFRDQPRRMQQGPHATIDALGPSALGTDDVRWTDIGSPATAVQATVVGQREVTLQVSVWSPSQRWSEAARAYLELLRTRMRFPSILEKLRTLGLALVRTENVVDLDPQQDGRMRSKATLDIRIAYSASETDEEIPYIEDARITSNFEDAGGDPLPPSVQFDINPTDPTP